MRSEIRCVNLEDDRPSVPQAQVRLMSELQAARRSGVLTLKIIHGYGSSGVGGDLRLSLQSTLRQMAERREIRDCIYGEDWGRSNQRAWNLVKLFPALKGDSDFDRKNRGITIVVL